MIYVNAAHTLRSRITNVEAHLMDPQRLLACPVSTSDCLAGSGRAGSAESNTANSTGVYVHLHTFLALPGALLRFSTFAQALLASQLRWHWSRRSASEEVTCIKHTIQLI